jgi:hypothetical protein
VGLSNGTVTEVVSGLKEGDQGVLQQEAHDGQTGRSLQVAATILYLE